MKKKLTTCYTVKAIACPVCGDGLFIFHANQQNPSIVLSVCTCCGCGWYHPGKILPKPNDPDLRLEGEDDYSQWNIATKEQIEAAKLGDYISRKTELFI